MSLKKELHSEQVIHLDLSRHCQIGSGTAVREVLAQMRQHGSNVCLIINGGTLLGIFTVRDVLQKVANAPETLDMSINDVMTPEPITVQPDKSAAEALWLMDDKRIRDLPVVEADGRILGSMTHRAVIDYLAGRYPEEILNLPPRPDQFPRKAEGGD